MTSQSDPKMLLYRARLYLEEGRSEEALQSLQALQVLHTTDEQLQRDVSYLLGWCYVQKKQWKEAVEVLSPLLQGVNVTEKYNSLLERELVALYLLRLGEAAVNLGHHEDASLHFTICLKVLHDRRVHLPSVRIKARYYLGMTCIVRGLYPAAIQHYEEALRLCRHYNNEEEMAHVYHGLCDAYRHTGDFARAITSGQEALRLYRMRSDREMEARVYHLMGRVSFLLGDLRAASDHYTESLAIATGNDGPTMAMLNCVALADVRLAEDRLEEARRYCQFALETMQRSHNAQMSGIVYYAVGKIAHEEARRTQDSPRAKLLEEAVSWYQKASELLGPTQAYADKAEVYGRWAQALEELGCAQEAIDVWRSGYEMLSQKAAKAR
jgi:tetratricopeptide (TPR) repeat protein